LVGYFLEKKEMKIVLVAWCCLMAVIFCCVGQLLFAENRISHTSEYYNNKGIIFVKKGEIENAVECFLKSIELEPKNSFPYLNLGIIYKRKADFDKAIEYLNKALAIDENLQEAYTNFVEIYQAKGDLEKAAEYSHKALTLNQDTPKSIYNLGYAYLLEGDREAALAQYDRLKELEQLELASTLLDKINQRQKKAGE